MSLPTQDILINPYEQYGENEKRVFGSQRLIVPTFSPALNARFDYGGIEPAQVMMLGAKSGIGKTYFILNWIRFLMENKFRITFFSLDMEFRRMFIALLRQILEKGRVESTLQWKADKEHVKQMLIKSGYFDYLRIYTNEKKIISFDEISFICDKEKPDIVFIDHFSKVWGTGDNVFKESKTTSEYFWRAKRELNTIFVILIQMKKAGYGNYIKKNGNQTNEQNMIPPGEDEYKGAGEIKENADILLSLSRPERDKDCPEGYKGKVVGAIRKNRNQDVSMTDHLFWNYSNITTRMWDSPFQ